MNRDNPTLRDILGIFALVVLAVTLAFIPLPGEGQARFQGNVVNRSGDQMQGILLNQDGQQYANTASVSQQLADLETSLLAGRLLLYYSIATDSVTGGRLLRETPDTTASYVVYAALSATTYTQVNSPGRVSSAGVPGVATLTAGPITTVRYMSQDQPTSSGRDVTGINELWLVDADGSTSPTFVATSSTYIVRGTDIQRVTADYSLSADVTTGGTTRRFLEKHFRKRTGVLTGGNPVVTVQYGGIYEGIMSLGLDSAVTMKTDASNADAAAARGNLGIPNHNQITVNASGNVGVGVTAPQSRLDLADLPSRTGGLRVGYLSGITFTGDVDVMNVQYALADSTTWFNSAGYNTGFKSTSSNATLFLQSNGNVGIATTTPTQALEIIGGLSLRSNIAAPPNPYSGTLIDYLPGSGIFRHYSYGPDASTRGGYLFGGAESDAGNYLDYLTITSAGNVGIATTTPHVTAVVVGSASWIATSGYLGRDIIELVLADADTVQVNAIFPLAFVPEEGVLRVFASAVGAADFHLLGASVATYSVVTNPYFAAGGDGTSETRINVWVTGGKAYITNRMGGTIRCSLDFTYRRK